MGDPEAQLAALRRQLKALERSIADLAKAGLGEAALGPLRGQAEALRLRIETGGGAAVVGDVTIEQGDFVGRDKWQLWVERMYVGDSAAQVGPDVLLRAYLRAQAADCRRLPLPVVDPRFLQTGPETPVPLPDVYVDLDVVAPFRREREKAEQAMTGRMEEREGGERTPLLAAITHPEVTRFVLLGDPGSGKTTFTNYVTYALAAAAVEGKRPALLPEDSPLWGKLPVRLVLREVAARCIPPEARGEGRMLWQALRMDLAARLGEDAAEVLFSDLQGRLLEEGGLVLLDGLDEVPEANRRRTCLVEAVADLTSTLSPDQALVVVTARPYAYDDPRWRLPGFETLHLAPFSSEQMERFIGRWQEAVRPAMAWDEITARGKGESLLEALEERPYLAALAARPLLLTLMATLHTSWGQLPQDRANLYEESVKLLLSRWQRAREVIGPDGEVVVEPGIARVLAVEEEGRVRAALHRLACDVHERQGGEAERTEGPADVAEGEVLAAFAPLLPEDVNPRLVLRYLETRAGLLVGRAPGVYAFPHRSFQEYLAACHLADGPDFASQLRRRVLGDPSWWQEVFLLGVGRARQGGLGSAVGVVNVLLPAGPEEVAQRTATDWQAAVLAGRALVDLRFPGTAEGKPDFDAVLKRARRWLLALLEEAEVLSARQRAEAGNVLGHLGDPRFHDPLGLPGFVPIEGGAFWMGEDDSREEDERPRHRVTLDPYEVARFPTTNGMFARFVEDGGYAEERWWTEAMADGRWSKEEGFELGNLPRYWDEPRWNNPSQPVMGVSWYEAAAYCRWLTAKADDGHTYRLPTEAEWERAARGSEGYRYPWGEEWEEGRCNSDETGLEATSPVGIFPRGMAEGGVHDMVGNVYEWCWDWYAEDTYARSADANNPTGPEKGYLRVLRGGSCWREGPRYCRCGYRCWFLPGDWNPLWGFRCVRASSSVP